MCCHAILISLMISIEVVAAGCPQYPPFTPVANLSGNPDVSLALAKAESLLQSVLQENPSIPGMVALAMHGSEVFWTAGLGLRNVTDPNSGELRFNRTTRLDRSYVHIVLYLLLLLRLCTAVDLRFGRTHLKPWLVRQAFKFSRMLGSQHTRKLLKAFKTSDAWWHLAHFASHVSLHLSISPLLCA